MKCAKCGCLEDKVIDSRISKDGYSVRRRRECLECAFRYTTVEEIIPTEIVVIKRDQSREEFKPNKVREGIRKACWKRPLSEEQIDRAFELVRTAVENVGERDISSLHIGRLVMDELKRLDEVAYVRFASVYRQFKDVDEFINEIKQLRNRNK